MKIGYILIIFGVAVLVLGTAISMATVLYAPIKGYWPSGDSTYPTPLPKNQPVWAKLILGSEVESVEVTIKGTAGFEYEETFSMPFLKEFQGLYVYSVSNGWYAPAESEKGQKFAFHFYVENQKVLTTYIKVIKELIIDGYFTINNQKVDELTTLVVYEPDLDIAFHPTHGANKIIAVWIDVTCLSDKTQEMVTLTKQDTEWTVVYELPHAGGYKINGYFGSDELGKTQAMSIIATWEWSETENGDEETKAPLLNKFTMAGLGLIAFGVILTAIKRR